MAARRDPAPPPLFQAAVNAMLGLTWRTELQVSEIPAPGRIAPHSAALSADVVVADQELGSGRLVLLHEPGGNPAWDGDFRCVTYIRSDVDPEMVTDPLLTEVGWSWLLDALARHGAEYTAPSGTVTAASGRSFGGIAEAEPRAEVELRASWTPIIEADTDVIAHLNGWAETLCQAAGLPPLPEGVVPLSARRSGSWLR